MIERGHVHRLAPVAVHDLPNGNRQIQSQCRCGLEEQRQFDSAGVPVGIRFRYQGVWLAPLDLLRLAPVGVEECAVCHGEPGIVICEACAGLGVQQGGQPIVAPDLTVRA